MGIENIPINILSEPCGVQVNCHKDMMNIFASLRTYAGKWAVKGEPRNFTEGEINAVKEAVVVPSTYGLSVCFFMKSGGQTYIPLSSTSQKGSGEIIDLTTAKLVTLCKDGESDIYRVEA